MALPNPAAMMRTSFLALCLPVLLALINSCSIGSAWVEPPIGVISSMEGTDRHCLRARTGLANGSPVLADVSCKVWDSKHLWKVHYDGRIEVSSPDGFTASNMCMASEDDTMRLVLVDCDPNDIHQIFILADSRLTWVSKPLMALDFFKDEVIQGDIGAKEVGIKDANDDVTQKWYHKDINFNFIPSPVIQLVLDGGDLCLDASPYRWHGVKFITKACVDDLENPSLGKNQRFVYDETSGEIQLGNSIMCITTESGSGSKLYQSPCTKSTTLKSFTIDRESSTIKLRSSRTPVKVFEAGLLQEEGSLVRTKGDRPGVPQQLWRARHVSEKDGKFVKSKYCPSAIATQNSVGWKGYSRVEGVRDAISCTILCEFWTKTHTTPAVNPSGVVLNPGFTQEPTCQFVWYSSETKQCRIYFSEIRYGPLLGSETHIIPEQQGIHLKAQKCRHASNPAKGAFFYVRPYQITFTFGPEIPVGNLGDKLLRKLKDFSHFSTGALEDDDLVPWVMVHHCDRDTIAQHARSKCSDDCLNDFVEWQAHARCGTWEHEIRFDWISSLHKEPKNSKLASMSTGKAYRNIVYNTVKGMIAERTKSRQNTIFTTCRKGCNNCGGRRVCRIIRGAKVCRCEGKDGDPLSGKKVFDSQSIPQTMSMTMWRFRSYDDCSNGECMVKVFDFGYKISDADNVDMAELKPSSGAACGSATNWLGIAVGIVGMIGAPFFGWLSLGLSIGCAVEGEIGSQGKGLLQLPGPPPPSPTWNCTFCDTVVAEAKSEYLNRTAVFEMNAWYDPNVYGHFEDVNASEILPAYHEHVPRCDRFCWNPDSWNQTVQELRPLLDPQTCTYTKETLDSLVEDKIRPAVHVKTQCKIRREEEIQEDEKAKKKKKQDETATIASEVQPLQSGFVIAGIVCGVASLVGGLVAGLIVRERRRRELFAVLDGSACEVVTKRSSAPSF